MKMLVISCLQAEEVHLKPIKVYTIQSLICFCKMWKSRIIFFALWLSLNPLQALEHEVVGLADLMKDFLPLSNTELVFISDFNSEKKVNTICLVVFSYLLR